jgi:hypothetical protein
MAAGQEQTTDTEPVRERAAGQEAKPIEEAVPEQEPAAAVEMVGEEIEVLGNSSMVEQAVAKELAYLKKVTRLDDGVIAGMKLGMKPLIRKEAGRQGQMFAMPNMISPSLLKAIANAAELVVPDKKLYAVYREDIDLRLRFDEAAAVTAFTQTLGSMVGLTTSQGPACEKLARKLYKQGTINGSTFLLAQGSLGPVVKAADLKTVLTEKQLKYFKEFNTGQAMFFDPQPTKEEQSAAEHREELVGNLRKVIAMKIDQVDGEFKLDARQRRKLELVGKSIISKTVAKRVQAEVEYKQWMAALQAGNDGFEEPDPEMMALATAGPVQLFENQAARWDKYVTGTLNDKQKATWEAMKKSQAFAVRDSLCYMLVKAFGAQLNLTGKQQAATHKLMSNHLGPVTSGGINSEGIIDSYRGLLDIKDADFAEAMGDDNWQTFKPQMNELRQQIEVMDKKKADEETDE